MCPTGKTSSWTYSHELGRMHLQNELKDNVTTVAEFNIKDNDQAANVLQKMVDEGCQVIFTTAPPLLNATLKAAMANEDCNF